MEMSDNENFTTRIHLHVHNTNFSTVQNIEHVSQKKCQISLQERYVDLRDRFGGSENKLAIQNS